MNVTEGTVRDGQDTFRVRVVELSPTRVRADILGGTRPTTTTQDRRVRFRAVAGRGFRVDTIRPAVWQDTRH